MTGTKTHAGLHRAAAEKCARGRQGDSLEVVGEEVAAAVGPGPRVRVVVQHPGHGVLGLIRPHKLFTFEVVVVRNV